MKKLFALFFALSLVPLLACEKYGEDKPVDFKKLPVPAQTFVNTNYPDVTVSYVTRDDDIIRPDYTVGLVNGVKIDFDNGGALEKIETLNGEIPEGVIPVQIVDYVKAKYPDTKILEYDVEKYSYEVKLSNRLELKFNTRFALVEIGD